MGTGPTVITPVKQHLIDPEICIRCYTCEMTCPIGAIEHNDDNVVVDVAKCNYCMACIPVCPTGSIDEWRVVDEPYTLEQQYSFEELPDQEYIELPGNEGDTALEALDDEIAALLAKAHKGAGGKAKAPASASKPSINLFNLGNPATATVQGNFELTKNSPDNDVRHIILDFGRTSFPVLEGQSIGIIPPGTDKDGSPHLPRLYSISSPRDGERQNFNNVSLTVSREEGGIASNYLCDVEKGAEVKITGPFGSTFLVPNDMSAKLLMICTGTGSAPFRAFTMHRQRTAPEVEDTMTLIFGARRPDSLPYFGPLRKLPDGFLKKHLVFSRSDDTPKRYVQDELIEQRDMIAELLGNESTHIYICGLKEMEKGVEDAFRNICDSANMDWLETRDMMRQDGRFHVETY